MTEDISKEAYYEASWNTVVSIAMTEYGFSHHIALIYAWNIFGRMTHSTYKKLEH